MADNTTKDLADLLSTASESFMDFVTITATLVQAVTAHIVDDMHVARKTQGKDVEDGLRNMMTISDGPIADYMHFLMSAVIAPIVCFFGMAGNLLSIITWSRPGMGSSTGRYLTGQAAANFSLLLMFILSDSVQYWSPRLKYSAVYGAFYAYVGFPIFYFAMLCTIWITVGLTVDRYIMVCCITKAKKLCSESRANIGLFLITINCFITNLPHFAFYTIVYPDNIIRDNVSHSNNTRIAEEDKVAFVETEFGAGETGKLYDLWIHCAVLVLVPWVSVFFMNIMIIVKISVANKRMANKKTSQALKKSKESEHQVTRLLLAVTFTFLFFIGTQCIVQCLWLGKPPGANWQVISASFALGKTGVLFNSSLNFVLYCLTGRRFRVELLKMLGLVKKDMLLSSYFNTSSSTVSTTTTANPSVSASSGSM